MSGIVFMVFEII